MLRAFVRIQTALGCCLLLVAGVITEARGEAPADPAFAERAAGAVSAEQCVSPEKLAPVLSCDGLVKSAAPLAHRFELKKAAADPRLSEQREKLRAKKPAIEIDVAALQMRPALARRAHQLLDHELGVLRRLAKNTARASKHRPGVLARLADALLEAEAEARSDARSFDEPLAAAGRDADRARAQALTAKQHEREQRMVALRSERIAALTALCDDHPQAPHMDQQLFALAFALDEAGQLERSRKAYTRLVEGFPQSPLLYNAYLAFAEHHFAQGAFAKAKEYYSKVLEAPADHNPYFGFALYKLAWCEEGLDNFPEALRWFMAVLRFAREQPTHATAQALGKQVLRELVVPYARSGGGSEGALGFFVDVGGGEAEALKLYESLAELYFDQGEWVEAIGAYEQLLEREPESPARCLFEFRISSAELALGHRERGVEGLEALVNEWERLRDRAQGSEVERACKEQAVMALWDLAVSFHREGMGTDGHEGTKNVHSLALAARLYEELLDKFKDLDQLALSAAKERPSVYEARYYYAEILWSLSRWAECGPAFDRVVELDPQGARVADAAYASLLCYNRVYEQELLDHDKQVSQSEGRKRRRAREPREPARLIARELSPDEQNMVRSFSRYLCVAPQAPDAATVKYRRARIYYEANRFDEAAQLFREVALGYPNSELVDYAGNLYLDSLNALASRVDEQPRLECYSELERAVSELYARYCQDAAAVAEGEHAGLCPPLVQLRCDIERKAADTRSARREYRDAAMDYLRIFREGEGCSGKDELLYNAAINFEAAKLVGRAIRVRMLLRERFPESRLSARSLYLIGSGYQALALYANAAEAYERFASDHPDEEGQECSKRELELDLCAKAQDALRDAVFFRLGLGDDARAVEDGRLYQQLFGKKHAREASEVVFALGSLYERAHDWSAIERHYRQYLHSYRHVALPHEQLKAQTMVGVALFQLGQKSEAEHMLERVRSAFLGGLDGEIQKAAGGREEVATRWLAEARQSAAEALFYLGEARREVFNRFAFPDLHGHASLDNVNRWAAGPFAKWIKRKGKALAKAEQAYGEVRRLEVPIWDIAAASKVGVMYRSFVDDFRDAPVPAEIRSDPELMDIYLGSLDEKSEPWLQKATGAFELCLSLATRIRWFNEHSQACELELSRLEPRLFPQSSELRGSADHVLLGAATPLPPGRDARKSWEGARSETPQSAASAEPAQGAAAARASLALDACASRDDPLCFELP